MFSIYLPSTKVCGMHTTNSNLMVIKYMLLMVILYKLNTYAVYHVN